MKTPASVRGHPIHPMLIVIPLGLWIFSFVADVLAWLGWNPEGWWLVARYTMGGGIIGALLAAVPGLIDYAVIDDPQTKRIATFHMALNLSAVALYTVNVMLRVRLGDGRAFPAVLSLLTLGVLTASSWLGGELVYRHYVSVSEASEELARR